MLNIQTMTVPETNVTYSMRPYKCRSGDNMIQKQNLHLHQQLVLYQ